MERTSCTYKAIHLVALVDHWSGIADSSSILRSGCKRTSQTEVMPPHQMTGGLISIRPLSTGSEGRIPREPQVSIVGDQIHIEIFSPAVIKIHPPPESPTVKSEPEHPR